MSAGHQYLTLLSRFQRNDSGNIAIIFALALLPILAFVGSAIDYSMAVRAKAKLAASLDAAMLAATGYTAMRGSASDAKTAATNMFNGQMSAHNLSSNALTIDIADSVTARTVTGTANVVVKTVFMYMFGYPTMTISTSSSASASFPTYMDFYVLVDNSPSQGLGATTADMTKLQNATSDKCAFACHDTYTSSSKKTLQTNSYYQIAKNKGVTMRIDVVRSATQSLTDTATASQVVSNQYRMAVYSLGSDCGSLGLTTIASLSSSMSSVKSSVGSLDLMTIPYNGYNNDMCTDFDGTMSAMNGVIPTQGDGSSSKPQKWLFFVSDGVADYSYPTTCSKTVLSGGRCQEPLNTTTCTALKARGIKIAVLYTTYLAITNNSWYTTYIAPWRDSIGGIMKSCASPGYYYEVDSSGSIGTALTALFQQAIASAHLTK
ncbi:TadE/TadG family type IV pilus assembly protein [Bradyrhizobium aeschynomenes]|uniref:TadE/TadG family type IV pilus assembly protein n=1 Tax=Bradyrhizobium aeschynomenes TaxID=2734909 RepID=UPI001551813F|nr:TadE/TadG family type IV pilus assembly protein [Bradyrhizobium aeschynomenes]NPV23846.1 pilus assembly protein [Bradyrhizobium aeschynomenes]